MNRYEMKKQLINEIATSLKSYGYTVYVSKDCQYGFYTDGKKVVSFGGQWAWAVDFSGNYKAATAEGGRRMGTGWQIAKKLSSVDRFTADRLIKEHAPQWATGDEKYSYTTPEQHLKTYGSSSGYTEFKGD